MKRLFLYCLLLFLPLATYPDSVKPEVGKLRLKKDSEKLLTTLSKIHLNGLD